MVDLTGGFALSSKMEMKHADNAFQFLYENQHKLIMTPFFRATFVPGHFSTKKLTFLMKKIRINKCFSWGNGVDFSAGYLVYKKD